MGQPAQIVIVVVAGIALVIIGIIWRDRRNKRRFFNQLIQSLGAVPVKRNLFNFTLVPVETFTITQGNLQVEARYRQGRRRRQFILSVPAASPASFQISSGRRWIKFLRAFGRGQGSRAGDMQFDERFYVDSNAPEFILDYLTPQRKEAVAGLFGPGFYALELNGGTLTATWSPFKLKKDTDAGFVGDAIKHLATLTKDIPSQKPYEAGTYYAENWYDNRKRWFWGILLGAIVLLGIFTPGEVVEDKLVVPGLEAGFAAYLVFMGIAAYKLGHKAWFGRILTRFGFPALILIPVLGITLLTFMNNALDVQPAATHVAQVVGKEVTGSGRDRAYILRVKSWHPGSAEESIRVDNQEYARAVPNQSVLKVDTKPGRLGQEWIASTTMEIPAAPTPELAPK